jgi:Lipid A 3-O-deacylase (PagL).
MYFLFIKMRISILKLIICLFIAKVSFADENNSGVKFYTGMFDFSDEGAKSQLFGIQHQNADLYRGSFLGELSPVSGAMFTQDNAVYLYSGIETNYSLGPINITPSFAPGYYRQGDGKDLGHGLEFKTELQLSFDLGKNSNLGMSYNHLSNASLGDKNPGANSYTFNFLKKF